MLFRKQEPKQKNMCITIMIGMLAVIGAYTVVDKGRKLVKEKAKCLGNMMGMMSGGTEECQG